MEYIYRAHFAPEDDGGYLVTFPDVPEAITQGDDMADARASAADALEVAIRGRLADGKPVPQPAAKGKGLVAIPLDAETVLKVAVIEAFAASGMSKVDFGRRLGKADNEAYRILDPNHPTKLGVLQASLALLGKQVIVSVRDAA